jgi:type II secretory pathway component PulC
LPPPLFPGQQQQPAPPAPAVTPPPPKEASGAVLVGLVGDSGSVAIIRLGRETFIVSAGDVIKDKIKVTIIDVAKSMVILEQEGERFELRMGGVSGRNVAA